MDERIVRSLNGWFSATSFRADLDRFLALAPLVAIIGLVIVAWLADWGRAPDRRAILVVGILGTIVALALNVALGHLYYRSPGPSSSCPSTRCCRILRTRACTRTTWLSPEL